MAELLTMSRLILLLQCARMGHPRTRSRMAGMAGEEADRAAQSGAALPGLLQAARTTILTQALNSSVSNSEWAVKRPELLKYSLLPINRLLHDVAQWDEAAICKRSDDLLVRALKIWPRHV
ncbi:HNH endonuclease family protein [Azoarcus sp. PA01]|nr:HNH endonuclease family protein [Azoarcus sp. PA01]KON82586.2 HNH endonuclease family protein [Azoarcus sp. PA01]